MFRETKQKSLEEIDLLFGARAAGNLTSGAIEREQKHSVTRRHEDAVGIPMTPRLDDDKKD